MKRIIVKASKNAHRNRRVYATINFGAGPKINPDVIMDSFNRLAERLNWEREDYDLPPTKFSISNIRYNENLSDEEQSVLYDGILTDSEGNSVNAVVGFIAEYDYDPNVPNWYPAEDTYDDSDYIFELRRQYRQVAGLA